MSCYHIIERRKAHRGFTLIELLVVIVIIGILASLILVGGRSAMRTANQAAVKQQISQVEGALERYKQKYGEYPPDFSDEAAVMRHVRKRWPKWQNGPKNIVEFCTMINNATTVPNKYDFTPPPTVINDCEDKCNAAHVGALAFWLGGIPDNNGMLNGFSADVSNPLGVGGITQWDKDSQFMELIIGSNCEIVDGLPIITAKGFPIAYFKPNAAGKYTEKNFPEALCAHMSFSRQGWEDLGIAVAYAKKGAPNIEDVVWHNPKSYQLIHPGLDGDFGGGSHDDIRVVDPAEDNFSNFTVRDRDNQANFGGTTIESAGN